MKNAEKKPKVQDGVRTRSVRRVAVCLALLCLAVLAGGCAFAAASLDSSRAVQTAVQPSVNPTAPARSASSSDTPAMDPLLASWRAAGMEPFCMQLSDTDGDGQKEWLGLVQGRGGDTVGIHGFVLDDGRLNMLGALAEGTAGGVTLGDDPVCRLSVGDLNADGRAEISAAGQKRDGSQQLSIFEGTEAGGYRLIAQFGGDERVGLEDDDRNGVAEVVVANRVGPGVALEEVSAWDGKQYVFSSSRYVRMAAYQGGLPAGTPEQALAGFYLALQERDMAAAYQLLSPTMRQRQGYEPFLLSVAAVARFDLGEVKRLQTNDASVSLAAPLHIRKVANGKSQQERYAGEWRMVQTEEGWRIDSASLVPSER